MTFTALILLVLISATNIALGFAVAAWTGHGPPLSFYLPSRKTAAAEHAAAPAHSPPAHSSAAHH